MADRQHTKFWLAPVESRLESWVQPTELNQIRRMIVQHEQEIIEAWHEHWAECEVAPERLGR
jgi:hypothetical protein